MCAKTTEIKVIAFYAKYFFGYLNTFTAGRITANLLRTFDITYFSSYININKTKISRLFNN